MKITQIGIVLINEERLKAYVSIVLEDCFTVKDIKVIQGNNGLFVAMPSKKRKDGQFKDIAHPLNQEFRDYLEKCVFDAYEKEIKSMEKSLKTIGKD